MRYSMPFNVQFMSEVMAHVIAYDLQMLSVLREGDLYIFELDKPFPIDEHVPLRLTPLE